MKIQKVRNKLEKSNQNAPQNTAPNIPCAHKSKIGGQALFEGVMMRGIGKEAMAVRKKDGTIHIESKDVPAGRWYQKTLFIRGVFNFILSMKNGYAYMMKSMDISGFLDDEEEEKKEKERKKLEKKLKKQNKNAVGNGDPDIPTGAETASVNQSGSPAEGEGGVGAEPPKKIVGKAGEALIGILGLIGGIALAVGLFMFTPNFVATQVNGLFEADLERFHSLFAGIIRIILFVLYMWAIALMKEIRTTYEYHGAEHMTIAAYEGGEKLDPENVENIKKYKRFHPRCGTSFIFLVLAISILIYSILPLSPNNIISHAAKLFEVVIVPWQANLIRTVIQILLLPFLVGITYEVIKLAGRYDNNIIMKAISAPGLGLQRLTTKEPNDMQLQVAVSAMLPVMPVDEKTKEEDKW
jgi:uncharacterized protein YqhQ